MIVKITVKEYSDDCYPIIFSITREDELNDCNKNIDFNEIIKKMANDIDKKANPDYSIDVHCEKCGWKSKEVNGEILNAKIVQGSIDFGSSTTACPKCGCFDIVETKIRKNKY